MNPSRTLFLTFLIAIIATGVYLARSSDASGPFETIPLPAERSFRLFDIGVTDVDNDGNLDIFTSNHHFRQLLLIADGQGGYRDSLSRLGLDQSREFPNAELAFAAPEPDQPGLYIYWYGTQLVYLSHQLEHPERFRGVLKTHDWVKTVMNRGFEVAIDQQKTKVSRTTVTVTPGREGKLVLNMGGQGLPLRFEFDERVPLDMIHVGQNRVPPTAPLFFLTMQDRHALAWTDFNGDGTRDVFIDRGALGGRLRAYPLHIIEAIHDELLVSTPEGKYENIIERTGIVKDGCSGRHAKWLDFNNDGRLDLFINCYDRRNEMTIGDYPKQLYLRNEEGRFENVADQVGIGLPHLQFGSLLFLDVDDDGDPDLLAYVDEGIVLFRNGNGRYRKETLLEKTLAEGVKIGYSTHDEWLFDGKLLAADADRDGDPDLFFSSRRGNMLLINEGGKYRPVPPESVGLPSHSMTASWVDYDNDGRMDLHLTPQGLYRQTEDGTWQATGLLSVDDEEFRAAILNWFDADNDGHPDVLMALSEDPAYKPWSEFFSKKKKRPHWNLQLLRNPGNPNHWLEVKLVGDGGNPEGIGARVTLITPEGRQVQEVGTTDGAFFSQGHYRLHFGLGSRKQAEALEIRWSDGTRQVLKNPAADRLHLIRKASGPTATDR